MGPSQPRCTPSPRAASLTQNERREEKFEDIYKGGREKYSIFMKVLKGVVLKEPKGAKDEEQVAAI